MNDHFQLPPFAAIFGTGPSLKLDLINWSSVAPFRIGINAAAFAGIPGLTAASAMDFEALDTFGALDKNILVIHSVPSYRGKFQYELFSPPNPGWFTTANLISTLGRYGVKVVHLIGFDSFTYSDADYERLFNAGRFYSEDVSKLGIPWQPRLHNANPYKTVIKQMTDAFAMTGIIAVFRHLDPDLWQAKQVPEEVLADKQPSKIQMSNVNLSPGEAMRAPIVQGKGYKQGETQFSQSVEVITQNNPPII